MTAFHSEAVNGATFIISYTPQSHAVVLIHTFIGASYKQVRTQKKTQLL